MDRTRLRKLGHLLVLVAFLMSYALPGEAFARAGGGRSSGSLGSRPAVTRSSPGSQPSGQASQTNQYRQQTSPGFASPGLAGGGFMRGLAGGLLGGFVGSLLFRGLAGAGPDGGELGGHGGPGLLDLILIGGLLYLLYRFLSRRRRPAEASRTYYQAEPDAPRATGGFPPPPPPPAAGPGSDPEKGLRLIQAMDPLFTPAAFREEVLDKFFKIQAAWSGREPESLRGLLADELFASFSANLAEMKAAGRINRLENLAVRSVDLAEAWQEQGREYITTHIVANLLDYTVDDQSGQVVSGSRTDPVKFEEFWTFTRPVGGGAPWHLTAIEQVG